MAPFALAFLCLALLCLLVGGILTLRNSRKSPERLARVVCSRCGGWLSGLGQSCPHCGTRLWYAVSNLPDRTDAPEPASFPREKRHHASQ